MLDRWIPLPCSHRVVTGDHWLYQTAKFWFRITVNIPQQLFFSFTRSESRKRSAFFSLFKGCLAHISDTVLAGCHVFAEHGGLEPWLHTRQVDYKLSVHCTDSYPFCTAVRSRRKISWKTWLPIHFDARCLLAWSHRNESPVE